MKISDHRRDKLMSAIHDPIMTLRIKIENNRLTDLDQALFDLELQISDAVWRALEINDE